jgi:methylated-DNA-[protein]-cysteine S-methyltransferase
MGQPMKRLQIERVPSPIGEIQLVTDGDALVALDYDDCEARMRRLLAQRYNAYTLEPAPDAGGFSGPLLAYLAGALTAIDAIPVSLGGTPFQRQVWGALRDIPPGCVATYGELAGALGRAGSARAVGSANARNPVSIVVPCHRLVGADARLRGYAGGLERKAWLLRHERAPGLRK